MKFLLLFITLSFLQNTFAQQQEWTVKMGENAQDALGDSVAYKYPQFTNGMVYFRDGTASNGNLNLNLLNGEMQFIKPGGDTLALSDEPLIKYITIQNDTFYFSKIYVQYVYGNAVAKLGKVEAIKPVNIKKQGAYGQMSSASSINSVSFYYGNSTNQYSKLSEAKEVVLHKETFYFIGDKFNNYKQAFKKNIINMFGANKTAIEDFIKDNNIGLGNKEDLVKLVDFIQQVQH